MIVGVALEPGAQFAARRHRRLRLLGELERGMCRRDLGVLGALLRHPGEELACLVELAGGDRRAGEPGDRLEIAGLVLQHLR